VEDDIQESELPVVELEIRLDEVETELDVAEVNLNDSDSADAETIELTADSINKL